MLSIYIHMLFLTNCHFTLPWIKKVNLKFWRSDTYEQLDITLLLKCGCSRILWLALVKGKQARTACAQCAGTSLAYPESLKFEFCVVLQEAWWDERTEQYQKKMQLCWISQLNLKLPGASFWSCFTSQCVALRLGSCFQTRVYVLVTQILTS